MALSHVQTEEEQTYDDQEYEFNDEPPMTKQERRAKMKAKAEEELEKKNRKASGLGEVSKRATPRMTPSQTPKGASASGFPSQSVSPMAMSHIAFTPVRRIYRYKCPVFATTNRLG